MDNDLSFDELFDMAERFIRNNYFNDPIQDYLFPTYLMLRANGALTVLGCPNFEPENKQAIFAEAKRFAHSAQVVKAAFISEAWALDITDSEENVLPRDSENRFEIIFIAVTDGLIEETKSWEIIRGESERVLELKYQTRMANPRISLPLGGIIIPRRRTLN